MKKFFQHFTHKNETVLRRELMYAHTTIILLALGLITVLIMTDMAGGIFNHTMVIIVTVLLAVVALLSASIIAYILRYSRK